MRVIGRLCWTVAMIALVPSAALAQKKAAPKPQGLTLVSTFKPQRGFVDDPYVFDGPGGRLAVVTTDADTFAEIEIFDFNQGGTSVGKIDVTAASTSIVRAAFVLDGNKLLLVGRPSGEEMANALLVDFTGKVLRKWGPARDIQLTDVDGIEALALYNSKPPRKGPGLIHDVSIVRLDSGKVIKKRSYTADADGFVKALDMAILYWRQGYSQLVGRKKGRYDRFKDQRMNDTEAVYDLVTGHVLRDTPPKDLVAWTKLMKLRGERSNIGWFVVVTEDIKGLELITGEDRQIPVKLPEPFWRYDYKSLKYERGRDGRMYFTLTVDPVNPEAVDRKVADPEVIDLYVLDADGKATRLARLPKKDRPFSWKISGTKWVVLQKHKAFDRGGTELEIYELTALK